MYIHTYIYIYIYTYSFARDGMINQLITGGTSCGDLASSQCNQTLEPNSAMEAITSKKEPGCT